MTPLGVVFTRAIPAADAKRGETEGLVLSIAIAAPVVRAMEFGGEAAKVLVRVDVRETTGRLRRPLAARIWVLSEEVLEALGSGSLRFPALLGVIAWDAGDEADKHTRINLLLAALTLLSAEDLVRVCGRNVHEEEDFSVELTEGGQALVDRPKGVNAAWTH